MILAKKTRPVTATLFRPLCLSVAAALLISLLVSGCYQRLAYRHAHFSPLSTVSADLNEQAEGLIGYHQALQAAQGGCTRGEFPTKSRSILVSPESPRLAATAAREWARPCLRLTKTQAAYGGALNSFRRWTEDRVRELPSPSETASSIGGN